MRLECQHDHTHLWRHALRRHRASSPIVRTAAGLIQPSCRKRVSPQRRSRQVALSATCGVGRGGLLCGRLRHLHYLPFHRSRQPAQGAGVRRRGPARERARTASDRRAAASPRGRTAAGGSALRLRVSADRAPLLDRAQLDHCAAQIRKLGASVHHVDHSQLYRAYVRIYLSITSQQHQLGFYEAVSLPPGERRAHSKNHTTDHCNGGIFCRSPGSNGGRAVSDACRRTRTGGLAGSATDRARR